MRLTFRGGYEARRGKVGEMMARLARELGAASRWTVERAARRIRDSLGKDVRLVDARAGAAGARERGLEDSPAAADFRRLFSSPSVRRSLFRVPPALGQLVVWLLSPWSYLCPQKRERRPAHLHHLLDRCVTVQVVHLARLHHDARLASPDVKPTPLSRRILASRVPARDPLRRVRRRRPRRRHRGKHLEHDRDALDHFVPVEPVGRHALVVLVRRDEERPAGEAGQGGLDAARGVVRLGRAPRQAPRRGGVQRGEGSRVERPEVVEQEVRLLVRVRGRVVEEVEDGIWTPSSVNDWPRRAAWGSFTGSSHEVKVVALDRAGSCRRPAELGVR